MLRWFALCLFGCSTAARVEDEGDAGRAMDGAVTSDGPATPLKVLTINLKTALPSDGTFAQRTQIVADFINSERPDVVALQEITESGSMTNRGEALAMLTGYAFTWQRTHQLLIGNEGIGILARGTISWRDAAELPHTELGVLHRWVIGARVTTATTVVELFATHFTVAGTASERADQAAAAYAFARSHHQPGVRAVLAGDLNATPDELAMRMLRGETGHAGETGNLVDAWSGGPGFTIPSDAPDRRIDYIYMFPGATAGGCATVLAQPVSGVRASDHLGVLCEIR